MAKAIETPPTKFVIDYYNNEKQLESRWHYNYEKTKNGPVLVEEFLLPKKEKEKKVGKVKQ